MQFLSLENRLHKFYYQNRYFLVYINSEKNQISILFKLNRQLPRMFFGKAQPQKTKGKRTSGFQTRKDGQFSLGWNVNQNRNNFQVKRQQKEQNMAVKITDQKPNQYVPRSSENIPMSFEQKCRQLIEQNPNISSQELHQRMALWQRSNQPVPQPKSVQQPKYERPVPQRPIQSAKDAIYGGQNSNYKNGPTKASRRNQGTFSLGDGYNYFKDQNNGRK